MELLITDGRLLVADSVKRGAVAITENRIEEIGSTADLKKEYRGYRELDASGSLVMPGLVNTHTHAAMSLLRGYADDLPLQEWLEEKIWPLESVLTGRDIEVGARLAAAESLLSGTTCICSMYHDFSEQNEASGVAPTGIRAVIGHGCFSWREEKDKDVLPRFVSRWHTAEDDRIRTSVMPHAPYSVSPSYFEELEAIRRELEARHGEPLLMSTHVAETPSEASLVEQKWDVEVPNGSLFKYLDELGVVSDRLLAAHCIHLNEVDMDVMERRDVRVAHNPVSNFKLGNGLAPATTLLDRGVTVGLGTDSASSNNSLDMFETAKFTALAHKGAMGDPTVVPAEGVFKMATEMGARALHWDKLGRLEQGYLADLCIVDVKKPHLTPLHDEFAHFAYSLKAGDVTHVLVDGELVVEDGRLITVDTERLVDEVEDRVRDILERVEAGEGGDRPG